MIKRVHLPLYIVQSENFCNTTVKTCRPFEFIRRRNARRIMRNGARRRSSFRRSLTRTAKGEHVEVYISGKPFIIYRMKCDKDFFRGNYGC